MAGTNRIQGPPSIDGPWAAKSASPRILHRRESEARARVWYRDHFCPEEPRDDLAYLTLLSLDITADQLSTGQDQMPASVPSGCLSTSARATRPRN
jgi:hypothetical protein